MKLLEGNQEHEAKKWLHFAAEVAESATCFRSKCGAVIVVDDRFVGYGYNSPPKGLNLDHCLKDDLKKRLKREGFPVSKIKKGFLPTCCIHAEMRALLNALKYREFEIEDPFKGSRLYFVRLDEKGKIAPSGVPYCTDCSKHLLDNGVEEFCLWHAKGVHLQGEGIYVYPMEEFHKESLKYYGLD